MFIDFFQAFDSIHKEKMEQIFLAYGLPKETVTVITKTIKAMVYSVNGNIYQPLRSGRI